MISQIFDITVAPKHERSSGAGAPGIHADGTGVRGVWQGGGGGGTAAGSAGVVSGGGRGGDQGSARTGTELEESKAEASFLYHH